MRDTREERQTDSFVDSPSRPTKTAQEVLSPGTDAALADANESLDSIESKLDTANSNLVDVKSKLDSANTSLDNIKASTASIDSKTTNGTQKTQIINAAGANVDMNAGAPTVATFRTVGPITDKSGAYLEFLGSALTKALPIQIVGGDGLYRVTVDSLNRLSVNANIQFPEAVYSAVNLLNGTSKAMNVNGATTPVVFQYAPTATTYYVESLSYFIADDAAFSSSGFGALAALTNGLVIEYQSKGVLYTLTNIQSNGDIMTTMGDTSFGAINSGLLGTDAYLTGTAKIQQRIALDPAFGDFIRARVRDNLTGLTSLNIRVKVWRVN